MQLRGTLRVPCVPRDVYVKGRSVAQACVKGRSVAQAFATGHVPRGVAQAFATRSAPRDGDVAQACATGRAWHMSHCFAGKMRLIALGAILKSDPSLSYRIMGVRRIRWSAGVLQLQYGFALVSIGKDGNARGNVV